MSTARVYIGSNETEKRIWSRQQMPLSKKQLIRLVRLVAQLKENRYPNCSRFAEEMRKADLGENLRIYP